MAKLYNLARMTTLTTGAGPITLNTAVSSYLTFAQAGVNNGDVIDYAISDGSNREIGTGTYSSAGPTLTRSVTKSTNSNSPISLSGSAEVFITPSAETLNVDRNRQNAALGQIIQSKLYASWLRFADVFASGFKGASDAINGILTGSSSNYSVNTTGGYVVPTSGGGTTVTIGTNSALQSLASYTYADRTTAVLNNVTVASIGIYAANASTAMKVKVVQRNSAGNYTVVVDQSVNHPGGGWVDFTLSSPYTVPASGNFYLAVGYPASPAQNTGTGAGQSRSYIAGDATGTSGGWTEDTNPVSPTRYTYGASPNNMTLVGATQTADVSSSFVQCTINYDNGASLSPGIDYTLECTCNNGANWTAASSYKVVTTKFLDGTKTSIETNEVICASGTVISYRLKTLTNKNMPVYGIRYEWR